MTELRELVGTVLAFTLFSCLMVYLAGPDEDKRLSYLYAGLEYRKKLN